MAADLVRASVHYTGTVQGVGFRWRVVQTAGGFDVTGYVRNLADGRVELVAEGARADVDAFLAAVRSRLGDCIEDEQAEWGAATGRFRAFDVAR